MVRYLADPRRTEPPKDGLGERAMLDGWRGTTGTPT